MTQRRFIPVLFCAAALCAQDQSGQSKPKPPTEVDEALRARVQTFYQAHVDGKFRLADQVVAEENKDDFFAMAKPKYDSCQTMSVDYSENFTRARVVEACKTVRTFHGTSFPVTQPLPSDWKIEGGQWFWYLPPNRQVMSPFGPIAVHKAGENAGPAPKPLPQIDPAAMAKEIFNQIQLDRKEVVLRSGEPGSAEVSVKNGMPGRIRLRVSPDVPIPGLEVQLAKEDLAAGETGTIAIRYDPKGPLPASATTVQVRVDQTGKSLPFTIRFAKPGEAGGAPSTAQK